MSSLFESTKNTRAILKDSLRYIRSDVPAAITDKERQWLIDNGVLTIIDLRDESERLQKSCPLENDSAFHCMKMPVTGGNEIPALPEEVPASYLKMADETMEHIVDTIMGAKTNVLYFCNAGKDRTGVVSAIILDRLGYDRSYIAGDYVISGENLKDELEGYARKSPGIRIDVITPRAEYIEEFLDMYRKVR
ncbi:MAG: tyrosine-protein phosphatase [Ruminiclostridium sp.]|nr:tyrosine-protein phosphatase [Ruminiclostridium sp.]